MYNGCYRANVYDGETGALLFYKEFPTLADSAYDIGKWLVQNFAVELVTVEICKHNAFKGQYGIIIQTDEDGYCSILGKV